MRIAYLTQPYPPMVSGASIVAEQLAKAMADRGHTVLVVAASDIGEPYVVRKQNLTVVRLKSIRNPLRVSQRIMFMQRQAVLQALLDFKPDVIHVHEPVQMGLVGLRYVKHANIPITMTSHQLPWFVATYLPNIPGLRALVEKLVWRYARWLVGKYTTVISPTKTIANVIHDHTGINAATINYGVELETFHPNFAEQDHASVRAQFNIPYRAAIILHAGRLDSDKRVDRVILASAAAVRKLGAHLLIVGDGCEKMRLIKLCKALGIEAQVHFPGFVRQKEELAGIYRASTLFVTASEIETQGIVILQAAACGLPIVAVDAACTPEIVHDSINGYISQPGDTAAMECAIEKILHHPSIAHSMKVQSLLMAKKYNIRSSYNKHEELYCQLVNRSGQNAPAHLEIASQKQP